MKRHVSASICLVPSRDDPWRLGGLDMLQIIQSDINAGEISNRASVTTTTTAADGTPVGGSSSWWRWLTHNPAIDLGGLWGGRLPSLFLCCFNEHVFQNRFDVGWLIEVCGLRTHAAGGAVNGDRAITLPMVDPVVTDTIGPRSGVSITPM